MMVFVFLPIALLLVSVGFLDTFRRRVHRGALLGKRTADSTERNNLDSSIFRLAKRSGGKVSLSEIVIETGLELEAAEKYMDSMIDNSHVSMDVDKGGRLRYVFPELVPKNENSRREEGEDYVE
jgi:hypothetical protein